MTDLIKIAVDAMGGDGSPKKVVDGIIFNHKANHENFFRIFHPRESCCDLTPNLKKDSPNILLLGNSHADSIKFAFAESLKQHNLSTFFSILYHVI